MLKTLLFLISVTIFGQVVACAVPIQGEKYDKLITLEITKDNGVMENHILVFPKTVEGHNFDNIRLTISSSPDSITTIRPKTIEHGQNIITGLKIDGDKQLVTASVWWSGPCPIIGSKTISGHKIPHEIKTETSPATNDRAPNIYKPKG